MRPPEQPHPGEERGARADRKRTTNRWDMESQASAKPLTQRLNKTRSASAMTKEDFQQRKRRPTSLNNADFNFKAEDNALVQR